MINLTNLQENVRRLRALTDAEFCAVVKANAYGHGDAEVAAALHEGADSFAVALVDEGIALRLSGVTKEILVLTPPLSAYDVDRAREFSLTLSLSRPETAKWLKDVPVHLQLNTGMNRYGAERAQALCTLGCRVTGAYSHLYRAENPVIRERQYALFCRESEVVKRYYPHAVLHLSATGGLLAGKRYHFDRVRVGIGLYGYAPAGFSFPLLPVMRVYAPAVESRRYRGGGMGYRTGEPCDWCTTLRYGYADGFLRQDRLCMDSVVVPGVYEGWIPVMTDAAQTAKEWHTIPYEVLCRVTARTEYDYQT